MKRPFPRDPFRARAALLLACAAALTLGACDNDVNFSPTAPGIPFPNIGDRSVQITGSLKSGEPICLEATVLFDGFELPGSRVSCSDPDGCREIRLSATTRSGAGSHTISFQVLDQAARSAAYTAQGSVWVDREGINLGGVRLALGPEVARLRSGERVDFEIRFED